MIWVDYGIIGLISIFALIGLKRGVGVEAVSIFSWLVAFCVGLVFSQDLSNYLSPYLPQVSMRVAAAFLALFFLTLIVGRLLRVILRQLLLTSGLNGADRLAGLVLGVGRGILLVSIIVLLAGLTSLPRDNWWRESNLISPFQGVALWVKKQGSFGISDQIDYRD